MSLTSKNLFVFLISVGVACNTNRAAILYLELSPLAYVAIMMCTQHYDSKADWKRVVVLCMWQSTDSCFPLYSGRHPCAERFRQIATTSATRTTRSRHAWKAQRERRTGSWPAWFHSTSRQTNTKWMTSMPRKEKSKDLEERRYACFLFVCFLKVTVLLVHACMPLQLFCICSGKACKSSVPETWIVLQCSGFSIHSNFMFKKCSVSSECWQFFVLFLYWNFLKSLLDVRERCMSRFVRGESLPVCERHQA